MWVLRLSAGFLVDVADREIDRDALTIFTRQCAHRTFGVIVMHLEAVPAGGACRWLASSLPTSVHLRYITVTCGTSKGGEFISLSASSTNFR